MNTLTALKLDDGRGPLDMDRMFEVDTFMVCLCWIRFTLYVLCKVVKAATKVRRNLKNIKG